MRKHIAVFIRHLFFGLLLWILPLTLYGQEVLSFDFRDTELRKIFKNIEAQTAFSFFYNINEIDDTQRINLTATRESVPVLLNRIKYLTGIGFKIYQNQIVLSIDPALRKAFQSNSYRIVGIVKDSKGTPLSGANIQVSNTFKGTQSNFNGFFYLDIPKDQEHVEISYLGYTKKKLRVNKSAYYDIVLEENMSELQNVVLVGSRSLGRSSTKSIVPVDIIDIKKINKLSGRNTINALLNAIVPSFQSQPQTVSDGTDHTDPASLRSLGPDQVLVLINGKRRHTSSLINVNGTVGAGSVGTDLNAIPMNSIERIEILRDGASAQYGSDAIAGVLNIVLKNNTSAVEVGLTTGANWSKNSNHLEGGIDGEQYQITAGLGIPIGKEGGHLSINNEIFIRQPAWRNSNYSGEIFKTFHGAERLYAKNGGTVAQMSLFDYRNAALELPYLSAATKQNLQLLDLNTNAGIQSLRSLLDKNADKHELQARDLTRKDFRFKVGPSMLQEVKTFYNLSIPLNPQSELYAFGGISYRQGTSSGFYRIPAQKNGNANTALFPNGFLPELESKIYDIATTVGVKTNWKKWQLDISNTYGKNMFDLRLNKSSNSTLKNNSPTAFTLGGFRFSQNTTNVDLQNYFNLLDRQFSIALGAEFKIENYNILSGEATSYTTYDNNALAVTNTTIATDLVLHNFYGTPLLGGAQMYRGFEPKNAIDKNRNNLALYADIEADMMPNWTLNIATRFERFSDFGSTFIYKLAMRYAINEIFSIRSAINTGFRAPSLHQQFFRKTNTIFLENKAFEAAIFPNHSKEAALFKIPRLNEELSQNVSGGITMKQNNFFFTLDAYHIAIADRIVLSGAFSHGDSPELQDIFAQEGATSARFLVNAVDTKSIGLELVASHIATWNKLHMHNRLSATISNTKVTKVHYPELIQNSDQKRSFFDAQEEAFLTVAQPNTKWHLSNQLRYKNASFQLRNSFYGKVIDPDAFVGISRMHEASVTSDETYTGRLITDISFGLDLGNKISFTIGANNILDQYPSKNRRESTAGNQFVFSRRTSQFGYTGRFLFGKFLFHL